MPYIQKALNGLKIISICRKYNVERYLGITYLYRGPPWQKSTNEILDPQLHSQNNSSKTEVFELLA